MKSFEELCQSIKENNAEMEEAYQEEKRENKKKNKIMLTTCLIVDIVILLGMTLIKKTIGNSGIDAFIFFIFSSVGPIFVIDFFIALITSLFFPQKQSTYREIYKNKVIPKLVENFYEKTEYFPNKGMPRQIYHEGKYEAYDNYYSDDYMETTIDGKYLMDMAEVHTEEEHTSTDSKGNETTTTITLFHGIFAKIMLDKSIGCTLRICRGSNWDKSKERLQMDSDEFEKKFNVYTTDKIVGMQILTPDIMEALLAFEKKSPYAFDIYIRANDLYLRFHCGTMFEASFLKQGTIDEKSLKYYYDVLDFIKCFTDEMIQTIHDVEI